VELLLFGNAQRGTEKEVIQLQRNIDRHEVGNAFIEVLAERVK
jgi:hypothetical protein